MANSKIKVLRMTGFLVIGKIEQKNTGDYQELIDPRAVGMMENGTIRYVPFVGDPKSMLYKKADVIFEYVPDGKMEKDYIQAVSGLIMPGPGVNPGNVIPMPGATQ